MYYIEFSSTEMILLDECVDKDYRGCDNCRGGLNFKSQDNRLTFFTTDGKRAVQFSRSIDDISEELLETFNQLVIELPKAKITKNKKFRLYKDRWEVWYLKGKSEVVDKVENEPVKFLDVRAVDIKFITEAVDKRIEESESLFRLKLNTSLLPKDKIITLEIPLDRLVDKELFRTVTEPINVKISLERDKEPIEGCKFVVMPMRIDS